SLDRFGETCGRVAPPGPEDDEDAPRCVLLVDRLSRKLREVMRYARVEDGRLADPARPVEHCQPRSHEVRRDQLPVDLPTEEELGVVLGVREQAFVGGPREVPRLAREGGRLRHGMSDRPCWFTSSTCSRSTYSATSQLKTATPRSFQYLVSTSAGLYWTDQDGKSSACVPQIRRR